MYDLSIFKQFSVGGKQFNTQLTLSGGGLQGIEEPIPIAWAGVLTVRTDNNTGTLTMDSASHIITTGAIIDLFWSVGGVDGVQRKITVGTVAGTSVPIDLGIGDNLPAATSAVQACIVQKFTPDFIVGDNCKALLAAADGTKALICLYSTGDTVEELVITLPLNGSYDWITGGGTNPIAGKTIDKIHISIADTVNVDNVRFSALITP